MVGDGEYVAKFLMKRLWGRILHLPTGTGRTMKNLLLPLPDKLLMPLSTSSPAWRLNPGPGLSLTLLTAVAGGQEAHWG